MKVSKLEIGNQYCPIVFSFATQKYTNMTKSPCMNEWWNISLSRYLKNGEWKKVNKIVYHAFI